MTKNATVISDFVHVFIEGAIAESGGLELSNKLEEQGISVEVIDLRTLSNIDIENIVSSVSKTRRLLCVDGSWATCGISAEVTFLPPLCLREHLSLSFACTVNFCSGNFENLLS